MGKKKKKKKSDKSKGKNIEPQLQESSGNISHQQKTSLQSTAGKSETVLIESTSIINTESASQTEEYNGNASQSRRENPVRSQQAYCNNNKPRRAPLRRQNRSQNAIECDEPQQTKHRAVSTDGVQSRDPRQSTANVDPPPLHEMCGVPRVPIVRRANPIADDLWSIKNRLGIQSSMNNISGPSIFKPHVQVEQMVPFISNSGQIEFRRTIRLVDQCPMGYNSLIAQSPSTWTLRESGVDVSSGGIWNGGHSETVDTDHSISDRNESEPKQKRNRRRHRRSKAQRKDNLLIVNVAYDSDSKSSNSGQFLNEKSAPKQKRRRNRRNRKRTKCRR